MVLERYLGRFRALGGMNEAQIFCETESRSKEVFDAVVAETRRIEEKYSRFRDDSIVSRINASAGSAFVEVDEETAGLLTLADRLHALSGGLFDITSGALQKAWNFKEPGLPGGEALRDAVSRVGWKKARWDAPRFMLTEPGMHIDFGGFGKEYAVDRAAEVCIRMGVRHGLVNFGGDVRVIGPRPNGAPWRVGVRDPRSEREAVRHCELTSGALATSGDYERFKIVGGRRYCHIISPITGMPVQDFQSISVFAESCLTAGALSTIAMLKGKAEAKRFLKGSGCAAMLIDAEGRVEFVERARIPGIRLDSAEHHSAPGAAR